MKYIYLTETQDGFFYVGKHQWSGTTIDPDYHGSGVRLKDHPIKSTIILEDTTSLSLEDHNSREVYWITYYAQLLGVKSFPVYSETFCAGFYKYVRPEGKLLNCHNTTGPDHSSGLWCCDDSDPMYFPDIAEFLGIPRTSISSAWVNLGRPEQFLYHNHWIHRPGAEPISDLLCYRTRDDACASEQFRSGCRERAKGIWKNPNFLLKWRRSMREYLDDPTTRKRMSERAKGMWEDPEHVERMREAIRSYRTDPSVKEKMGNVIKDNWSDPDFRNARKEAFARHWSDPEYRDRMAKVQSSNAHARVKARPRYRLQDGFEGDYVEIASHINYTGKDTGQVSKFLRGALPIPSKWSVLQGATQIS